MAGNVQKGEAPTFLRVRLEIRLDKNLDGLFAGINRQLYGRVAKVDLVASSFRSSNDGGWRCPLDLAALPPQELVMTLYVPEKAQSWE